MAREAAGTDAVETFTPVAAETPETFTPESVPAADIHGPVMGGILDTMGATQRPGARTPIDVLARPEGLLERGAQAAVAAPAIYLAGAGGAAMGLPAVAGRIAASAGLGAGQSAARGESAAGVAWDGVLDGLVAAGTEGLISGMASGAKLAWPFKLNIGLGALGAPARAYQWALKAPEQALEFIRSRVPTGARVLNVPALGAKPLSPDGAVKALMDPALPDKTYRMARAELASELTKWDAQLSAGGPRPSAGAVFKEFTAKKRFPPSTTAKLAEGTRKTIASPGTRSAADAALTEDVEGVPIGAIAGAQAFGPVARRVLP